MYRSKKTLFIFAMLGISYVIIELGSLLVYYVVQKEAFSFEAIEKKRARILSGASIDNDYHDLQIQEQTKETITAWGSEFTIHPYTGWVRTIPKASDMGKYHLLITQSGFFAEQDPLAASKDPNIVIIGVTGASVAGLVINDNKARALLHNEFAKLPQFKGKHIIIAMFCIGGYKEPQQFMAVAYYLAQGGRLDMLINMDGVNDATGAVEELQSGVYPAYPFLWKDFFPASYNPNYLPALGELSMWKNLRYETAKAMQHVKYSVTLETLWTLLDTYLETRVVQEQQNIASVQLPDNKKLSYALAGPALPKNMTPQAQDDLVVTLWKMGSVEMDALAKGNHFSYFHFLQPQPYLANTKPLSEAEKALNAKGQNSIHMLISKTLYPRFEQEIARMHEQGINAYSLTHVFEHTTQTVYVDECCHLNELGNGILAKAIAAQVVDYYNHQK